MNSMKLVRKFMMPCGLCAVPLVEKSQEPQKQQMSTNEKRNLIRPSELSIYVKEEIKPQEKTRDETPTYLEQGFGTVRRSITGVLHQMTDYTDVVTRTIDTGLAHSQGALDYLKEESNTLPRLGAVGIGGLTGFIFGLRGGKFKRVFYATTGALTIAAICHPRQAQESWEYANHYANIIYNFVYGVKPGDEKKFDLKLPDISQFKMPSSFSEISDMALSAGNTVADKIASLAGKSTESSADQKENKSTADETKKSK